jgi:hypothetical protein
MPEKVRTQPTNSSNIAERLLTNLLIPHSDITIHQQPIK